MTADTTPMGETTRHATDDAAELPGIVMMIALLMILGALVVLAG